MEGCGISALRLLTVYAIVAGATSDVPAKVVDMSISPTTVLEHEEFVISCTVEGDPAPQVSIAYTIPGPIVYNNVTSGTVNVSRDAECSDSAIWICEASNQLSNGTWYTDIGNASVTVYCSPRPNHPQEYNATADIGGSADLVMIYIANPAPNVTWSHDGEILPETNSGGASHIFRFTSLNVSQLDVQDFFSDFQLSMDNGIGSYTATYRILPQGPPQTPMDVEAYDINNTSATIRWTSGYDMGMHQQFLLMSLWPDNATYGQWSKYIQDTSNTHGINQTWTYTRDNLHPGTEYTVSALAQNDDGYSKLADPPVTFKTTGASEGPGKKSSDTNIPLIVGLTVGGVCLLVIVLAIVFFYRRRRRLSYIRA